MSNVFGGLPILRGTSTPEITFATPGDLSVIYTNQTCGWTLIDNVCTFDWRCAFTPTYTTASGNLTLLGFPPFNFAASIPLGLFVDSTVIWPAGTTIPVALANAGAQTALIVGMGSATAIAAWTTTQSPTATARGIRVAGSYRIV